METSICGAECSSCGLRALCGGCDRTCGKPFGKPCFVARYLQAGGVQALEAFKRQLAEEVNALAIPELPRVTELVP